MNQQHKDLLALDTIFTIGNDGYIYHSSLMYHHTIELPEAIANKLANLPHGSGINFDWKMTITKSKVVLHNGYDCMDDNGYYDRVADFSLSFPEDYFWSGDSTQWYNGMRLKFHGTDSHYMNRKYMLRDYLEETFAYWLTV